jgi:hypothetical protein
MAHLGTQYQAVANNHYSDAVDESLPTQETRLLSRTVQHVKVIVVALEKSKLSRLCFLDESF